jgi:hypothetical protein
MNTIKVTNIAELKTRKGSTDTTVEVLGYYTSGDGGGGTFYWDNSSVETDNGGTIISVTGVTTGRWKRIYDKEVNVRWFGAKSDNLDNSIKVQLTLNAIPIEGAEVFIPKGVKFNVNNLVLPKKVNIKYFTGDNLNSKVKTSTVDNQIVNLIANADNDGIANEFKVEANLHPSVILNVSKNINNHPFLGTGQLLTNPVRSSYLIQDEILDRVILQYMNYGEKSNFSGTYLYNFIDKITLNGITTTSFALTPTIGTLITGSISGAVGYIESITSTYLKLFWLSGNFITGETVINNRGTIASPNNQSSSTTITLVINEHLQGNPLTFNFENGYFSLGLPPLIGKSPVNVGGRIAIQKTRSFGQILPETILNPSLLLLDSYENSTPNGFEIIYDTSKSISQRRLEVKNMNESNAFGEIGAIKAHTGFSNSVLPAYTSYNISSIVRNSTGDYTINFINLFKTTDFQIGISNYNPLDYTIVYARTISSLRIRNYITGTSTLQDLNAEVNVIITGGDYI